MQQTEMPAIVFDRAGDAADVLRWGTAPLPVLRAGHVRIRVTARPIQPADFLFIAARYRIQPRYPQVAGLEGVGVVDAVPPGEGTALLGRRVAFRAAGAWAKFVVAARSRVYEVPDDIDDALACQFALNPLTAWGLLDVAAIPPRGRLLLTAGASTVARLVAALAHQRGLATTLLARGHGAGASSGYRAWTAAAPESVVRAPDLAGALAAVDDGRGFDAVLDPVGGPATIALAGACMPGASMVSYGVLDDRPFELRVSTLVYRNLRWIGFGIDHYLDGIAPDALKAASDALWQLMRSQPALLAPAQQRALNEFAGAMAGLADVKEGKTILIGPAEAFS